MKAEEFGVYIRGLRKKAKLTIRQLELYSGVSNSYLSLLENGKRDIPSPEILQKLARPLKTPYEELMIIAGYLPDGNRIDAIHVQEIDREWAELYEKIREKGSELEAITLLRSAAGWSKEKLRDILRVLEHIEKDDD